VTGISTHVLDTSLGRPVVGIQITLEESAEGQWRELSTQSTDTDGRVRQMLPVSQALVRGQYRLTFHTQAYFDSRGVQGLYPVVQVTFTAPEGAGHYHIPLLLTANGYSTYRGS
jgi:5-hydroxyisourate hydrolase